MLAELRQEREQVEEAIMTLERLAHGRGNAVGDHRVGCLRSRDEGGRLGVRTSRRKRETAFAFATKEESYSAFFLRRSDRGSDGKRMPASR